MCENLTPNCFLKLILKLSFKVVIFLSALSKGAAIICDKKTHRQLLGNFLIKKTNLIEKDFFKKLVYLLKSQAKNIKGEICQEKQEVNLLQLTN